jgi:hypothetical protein
MITKCARCRAEFEDNYRSTLCPHRAFPANDGSNNFVIHHDAHLTNVFNEDYFLRGKQTGVSLYEDYTWKPDLTIPMVRAIVDYVGIRPDHTILDFGCARGYMVKALRALDYYAYGYDVSKWAVDNSDLAVYHYLTTRADIVFQKCYDWIIAKDVLEHVDDLATTIRRLQDHAALGIFVVVPLSLNEGEPYVVPEYEQDVTHIHRWPLAAWADAFMRPGWEVTARYRVPGIKDNYSQYSMGNGLLTCRRLDS